MLDDPYRSGYAQSTQVSYSTQVRDSRAELELQMYRRTTMRCISVLCVAVWRCSPMVEEAMEWNGEQPWSPEEARV